MLLKRFLGNIAKVTLAVGALSVSAFAGANEAYPYSGHGFYGHDMYQGQCGAPCDMPCNTGCNTGCCGTPCNPPPSCNWGYNPPAYPRCGDCCDNNGGWVDSLGVRVDFLWWRPSTDNVVLGVEDSVTTSPTVSGSTVDFTTSDIKRPKFKYDPGFRLGLAHVCPCDCWDVMLNWTHFHSKASATGFSDLGFPTTPGIAGTYTVFIPFFERQRFAFPDLARGHWTLNMDLLDLEFGSKYYVCSCFSVRPNIGLRGARIDQNYKVFSFARRESNTFIANFEPNNYDSFAKAKSDFLGLGPRVGVEAELDLGCGIALYGQGAASLLFGRFDRHTREFFTVFTGTGSTATQTSIDYASHGSPERSSVATTDLSIGLKWCHCFNWCNRQHPVSLAIAWEHHGFYNVTNFNFPSRGFDFNEFEEGENPFEHETERKNPADLFTQGVTASLSIGF